MPRDVRKNKDFLYKNEKNIKNNKKTEYSENKERLNNAIKLYKIDSFDKVFNKWQGGSCGYGVCAAFSRNDIRSIVIKC